MTTSLTAAETDKAAAPTQSSGIRRSVIGAAFLSGHSLLLNAISVFAMAYIIRRLGPEGYGQWATAMTIVAATGVIGNLGLRGTFIRGIARDGSSAPRASAEQLGARLLLSTLGGCTALAASLALGYSNTIIACTAIAAIGAILGGLWTTLGDLLQAMQQLPAFSAVNLIAGLALTAGSVVAAVVGVGPIGMSAAYLLGPVILVVGLWRVVERRLFRLRIAIDPRRSFSLLREARFFAVQQLVTVASTYAAALMLPKLVGAAAFAFFAAATLVAGRLDVVPDALATAFYPAMAREYAVSARGDSRRAEGIGDLGGGVPGDCDHGIHGRWHCGPRAFPGPC